MSSSTQQQLDRSLLFSISAGNLQAVQSFLALGAHLEAVDGKNGETPLARACSWGHYHIVHFLLRQGAEVDGSRRQAETTARATVSETSAEAARRKRAVVGGVNSSHLSRELCHDTITPLMHAVDNANGRIVKLLLRAGACVNLPNAAGQTALHWACQSPRHWEESGAALLEAGADVFAQDARHGRTPLFHACQSGALDAVHKLLVNYQITTTTTSPSSSSSLLSSPQDPSETTTATLPLPEGLLHVACRGGHLWVVRLLLLERALVDTVNACYESMTPLEAACRAVKKPLTKPLAKKRPGSSPFESSFDYHEAALLEIVKCLVQHGAKVQCLDRSLAAAARQGHADIVRYLLLQQAGVVAAAQVANVQSTRRKQCPLPSGDDRPPIVTVEEEQSSPSKRRRMMHNDDGYETP